MVFLEIISVQFQYLHYFSNSFVIDNIRIQWWGLGRGCRPPNGGESGEGAVRKFLDFLPRNGAFCLHSDNHTVQKFQAKANK